MNTTKNTENRSSQTHEEPSELFHPIDTEKEGEESYRISEEEKRQTTIWLWAVIFFIIGCIAVQHHPKPFLKTLPQAPLPTKSFSISPYLNANVPYQGFRLADLKNDAIRDAFDSGEENFIETQTAQEFSYRKTALFDNTQKTIFTHNAHFQFPKHKKSISKWLQEQPIQQITYKQFESYFTLNHQIFHLGDMVDTEQQIQFVDIDPVDRKIFFSDCFKNRYPLSY
ncbi:MAG: hypothetical protein J6Z25_02435 [Opitutales bacterium]|nr:hypothetical protein [Opitutales bacterium]